MHFSLAEKHNLPMYLHSRNCAEDFIQIVTENRKKFTTACVHSYTGGKEELRQLLSLGLYIGVNGCSLKTEENIEVVRDIPLDRIMLETDCPYCDITKAHASHKFVDTQITAVDKKKYSPEILVKGRNEPCKIVQVAEVVAKLKGVSIDELTKAAYENSVKVFGGPRRAREFGGDGGDRPNLHLQSELPSQPSPLPH